MQSRGPCLEKSDGGEKWEPKKNWSGWGKVGKWDLEKRKRGEGSIERGGLMEREKVLIEERRATEVG